MGFNSGFKGLNIHMLNFAVVFVVTPAHNSMKSCC